MLIQVRRTVSEKARTKTDEQENTFEHQPVMRPPEAPTDGTKWHLSYEGPAKERRKERETDSTFDSCRQRTALLNLETTNLTKLLLTGSLRPLTFQLQTDSISTTEPHPPPPRSPNAGTLQRRLQELIEAPSIFTRQNDATVTPLAPDLVESTFPGSAVAAHTRTSARVQLRRRGPTPPFPETGLAMDGPVQGTIGASSGKSGAPPGRRDHQAVRRRPPPVQYLAVAPRHPVRFNERPCRIVVDRLPLRRPPRRPAKGRSW